MLLSAARYTRAAWEERWRVRAGATRVLGVQSGNAIDGIDTVVVDFTSALDAAGGLAKLSYDVVGCHGSVSRAPGSALFPLYLNP